MFGCTTPGPSSVRRGSSAAKISWHIEITLQFADFFVK
jgi:hypothetical protein